MPLALTLPCRQRDAGAPAFLALFVAACVFAGCGGFASEAEGPEGSTAETTETGSAQTGMGNGTSAGADGTSGIPGSRTGPEDPECPCGADDCLESDDFPCAEGEGLCGGGVCHATGALTRLPMQAEGAWASAVRASPDGALIGIATEFPEGEEGEPEVILLDGDFEEVLRFPGATAVDVAPHEAGLFAIAYGVERVELRHVSETEARRTWDAQGGPLRFTPDGSALAMGSEEGVRLEMLAGDGEARTFAHEETRGARLWIVDFGAEGTVLATGRGSSGFGSPVGSVRIFDVASGERLQSFECPATSGTFSPSGTRFAAACWNTADLFDLSEARAHARVPAPDLSVGLMWLDVPGEGPLLLNGSFISQVQLLREEADGWSVRAAVELPSVREALVLPDGALLLAPLSDAGVHLWEAEFRSREQ